MPRAAHWNSSCANHVVTSTTALRAWPRRLFAWLRECAPFSARHRTESEATVERLIQSYALHHKTVVEFGCGTAEFLSLLCAKGSNHGIGYDPSQQNQTTRAGDGSVTICATKFSSASQKPVDLVCSQHVLEHLEELGLALRDAHACLNVAGSDISKFRTASRFFAI